MSITILRQPAQLADLQAQEPVAIPLTQPPSKTWGRAVEVAGAGNNRCGIWECSPGRFERQLASAETMHILTGSGSFTPTDGERMEFKAGDTLFFPAHTTGVWELTETLRKLYVVMV